MTSKTLAALAALVLFAGPAAVAQQQQQAPAAAAAPLPYGMPIACHVVACPAHL